MPNSELKLQRQSLHAFGATREAGADDAIDGVQPRWVVEPDSPDALAQLLAWASRERRGLVVRGGGTKLGWGRRPTNFDLVVSTRLLNRVLAHPHGDLTATVEAGTSVRALNAELARHGQRLPVDVAFDAATVGGLIATNEAGPLRHRYGTPRDQLIGVHLAMTDGRVVKAGGTVVKNVAGYDLGKLVSGSHGTLAAIVSATFKLAPIATASATAIATFGDAAPLAAAVSVLSASQVEPTAFEVVASAARSYQLLLQFATTPAAIDAQIEQCRLMMSARMELVTGGAEVERWDRHVRGIWEQSGTVVRASWLPANLGRVLALLDEIRSASIAIELVGRGAVGAGLIRLDGERSVVVGALTRLRAAADVLGHLVLLRADVQVKAAIDVWGPPGDRLTLTNAVKRAFDSAGVLNAGRGPL